MNGEPLPVHGFPVRMLVPGLYGYVSATKWLVDLEVTTYDAYDAYWVRRGWAAQTQHPDDGPHRYAAPAGERPGTVAIGGVAWAQHRGIKQVEVRVDDGDWQLAELGDAPTRGHLAPVVAQVAAAPGRHTIVARATDDTGTTQPEKRMDPFPSGATGWHSVVVTAS